MFHKPIQEKHSVRRRNKYGVVKVFDTTMAAVAMMNELPKTAIRVNHHCIWVPYPDVTYVSIPALTYVVDPQGVCHEQV